MKSNYSRFQDLPAFSSNKIEYFSNNNTYKVGDAKYNNLYDLLLNFDLLMKTQTNLQHQNDLMNKNLNDETDDDIKNQYKKNVSILEQSLLKTTQNISLFKNELSLIDKKDLIDLIYKLSNDPNPNPNNQTIRILKMLEKGI